jgi:hypothetical protein
MIENCERNKVYNSDASDGKSYENLSSARHGKIIAALFSKNKRSAMKKIKLSQQATRIPQIYGTYIFLGLTAYFFLCYALGVVHVLELRLFNFIFMCAGVYYAMKQYQRTHDGHLNYFRAMSIGVSSSFIGTSTFVLFLFILFSLNKHLYGEVVKNAPMGPHMNLWIATSSVWFEGMFSGAMATYILINLLDTDNVNAPQS